MERITNEYVFFWGSEFSNWFSCEFQYKDQVFTNSEQAFMWEKAMFFGDEDIAAKILKFNSNPRKSKELGRQVKNFNADQWMTQGYHVMIDVNLAKFEQNPCLKEILLSTGNKTIVEASPYDSLWGIGMMWDNEDCLDESKWKGLNLLGKALMDVRKMLR